MPTSTWATKARTTPHHVTNTPNGVSASMKTPQVVTSRKSTKSRWALTTWRMANGVTSIAS